MSGYKTYIGIIVAIAPTVAQMFGYQLTGNFAGQFTQSADDIVALVGAAFAIYGRLKATVPGWLAR